MLGYARGLLQMSPLLCNTIKKSNSVKCFRFFLLSKEWICSWHFFFINLLLKVPDCCRISNIQPVQPVQVERQWAEGTWSYSALGKFICVSTACRALYRRCPASTKTHFLSSFSFWTRQPLQGKKRKNKCLRKGRAEENKKINGDVEHGRPLVEHGAWSLFLTLSSFPWPHGRDEKSFKLIGLFQFVS